MKYLQCGVLYPNYPVKMFIKLKKGNFNHLTAITSYKDFLGHVLNSVTSSTSLPPPYPVIIKQHMNHQPDKRRQIRHLTGCVGIMLLC